MWKLENIIKDIGNSKGSQQIGFIIPSTIGVDFHYNSYKSYGHVKKASRKWQMPTLINQIF